MLVSRVAVELAERKVLKKAATLVAMMVCNSGDLKETMKAVRMAVQRARQLVALSESCLVELMGNHLEK